VVADQIEARAQFALEKVVADDVERRVPIPVGNNPP
jgi:hypothetical protein